MKAATKKKVTSISKTKPAGKPSAEQLEKAYSEMVRARKIDEKAIVLYKQNKCHFQIGVAGHEAVQVAAVDAMKPGYDWFYPYYRGGAIAAACGMTNKEFLLNIMNKADDPNSGGRQMPMHYGHVKLNIPSQSSPTGTQFLQAVGAAKACVYRNTDQVVLVSTGEGTTSQGDYHEAMNWAAREKLPVIFLVEDNGYAISVPISEQTAGESVASISSGYENLKVYEIDGLDYEASYTVMQQAVARARNGEGPTVVVAKVVRLQSHSISDNQAKYRPAEDIEKNKAACPILRLRNKLIKDKVLTKKKLDDIDAKIAKQIDEDSLWAEKQADPHPHSYLDHVYVDIVPGAGITERPATGEDCFMVDAINRALDEELTRNDEMVVFGQDVAHGKGGVFTVTGGLTAKHGVERVFNAPLAEASIAGVAVGMATLGMKPVAEIQFGDYIWTAMMQIRNELALMNYRSNGTFTCPAVIRVPIGGYIHGAVYHSQNIEATFAHFPGLYVVLPSNAYDAHGLLKAAIRGNDPVLFLEHKGLYRQVYAKAPIAGVDDLVPLGKAKLKREGTDATIITWGALVNKSMLAAKKLAGEEGVSVEVIDLRSILPLDLKTVLKSVRKTNRVLIAHEDVEFMGFGAEIAAQIADKAFEALDAPIKRVAGSFTPVAHAPILEQQILPQNDDVVSALYELLAY